MIQLGEGRLFAAPAGSTEVDQWTEVGVVDSFRYADSEERIDALREAFRRVSEASVEWSVRISPLIGLLVLGGHSDLGPDASGMVAADYDQEDLVDKIDFVLDRYREERV